MAARGKGPRSGATPPPPAASRIAQPPAAGYAPAFNAGFKATTDSVQEMHAAIASKTFDTLLRLPGLGVPTRIVQVVHDAITQGVYAAVRHGGSAAVSIAGGAERLATDPDRVPGSKEQALRSALNGVFGDALAASANPLAIQMGLHAGGRQLALAPASLEFLNARVVVFIHGLACDERSWGGRAAGWDGSAWSGAAPAGAAWQYGTLLERELPVSSIYLRYNTGLAIDANAKGLAAMLEQLLAAAPQVSEIVLIGHSMGGLVARRAHAMASAAGLAWPQRTPMLICLGSPHEGAPLEQLGALATAALGLSDTTRPLARMAGARSTGIKDLRRGLKRKATAPAVTDAAPPHAPALKLVFGSLGGDDASAIGTLVASVLGDGLVQTSSASASELQGDVERCAVPGLGHMALLSHPRVYTLIRRWLGAPELPTSQAL